MDTCLATAAAVVSLQIALLGHDDFQVREGAEKSLGLLYDLAEAQLFLAIKHPDPEVSVRVNRILQGVGSSRRSARTARIMLWLGGELKSAGWGVWPWIDSMHMDYPNREAIVLHYLERGSASGLSRLSPNFWVYREATRLYIEDLAAQGEPPGRLRDLVLGMVEGDKIQCTYGGYKPDLTGSKP